MMLKTPVVFLIFNRPDLTAKVFEAIASQKPRHLLVVADGPRNEAERELCEATRAVVSRIDWECEVETNFSEENLGCKKRVSSGLIWAFSRVEEAIILEDDCLPSPEFFAFCEEMLARYRDDERVMHITGDRFLPVEADGPTHYFSRNIHVWGWASWRRAWRLYDLEMKAWHERREEIMALLGGDAEAHFYAQMFDDVASGRIDTWDIQWMLTCFAQSGLSVIPDANLISNIGFRADATHTKEATIFAQFPLGERSGKYEPRFVFPHRINDARVVAMSLSQVKTPSLVRRIAGRVRRSVRGSLRV